MRHDGGDAETGFGLDVGGGLAWSHPGSGVSAEVRARGLLTHEADGFRDRGLSGSLAWDPRPDSDRGLALTLRHTMGGPAAGGMERAARARDARRARRQRTAGRGPRPGGDALANRRLGLELGYGFGVFGGRFTATPEAGLGLSNAGRDYRLGWRLGLTRGGPVSLELGLDATRREPAGNRSEPAHELMLRGSLRW